MEHSAGKNRPKIGGPEPVLLLAVTILAGIGAAMVYSASSEIALRVYGDEYYFFSRQLINLALGFFAMLVLSFVPYRIYRKLSYLMLLAAVVMLSAVLVTDAGHSAGGATRWLRIMGLQFQPAEFARLALIVFMAYSLSKKQERVSEPSIGFLPHFLVLCLFTVLILLQPDFGTIALLWILAWMIMFAGRVPLMHLASAVILIMPAALWLLFSADYRIRRYMTFLDPWKVPRDDGYQIIHSLMGFGSGGIFGKGFGEGFQKLFYLPTPHTDFIFSVIGEEGGLLWVLMILGLYLVILLRGMKISADAPECFGSLLAFGITAAIGLHSVVNMGVNLSLLPTKGLTLPFLSYGGSSLVFNLGCIGILMNIATTRDK
ncbi:MAG: putative lipid II flippase FtsW [Desulfosalsimonas sp.]